MWAGQLEIAMAMLVIAEIAQDVILSAARDLLYVRRACHEEGGVDPSSLSLLGMTAELLGPLYHLRRVAAMMSLLDAGGIMGRARKSSRQLWLALLPLIAACHSYRPATAAPQGAQVRVWFPAPRGVQGSFADSRPVALENVVSVEGVVTRMYGDTVELRLTSASNKIGSLPSHLYKDAQATIVLEPRTVLETRGVSKGKTALAIGGGATVLLAIGVIIVAVAIASVLAGGY